MQIALEKMNPEETSYVYGSLRVSLQLIDRAIARLDGSRPFSQHPQRIHLIRAMVEILEVVESLRSSSPDLGEASAMATKLEASDNELFKSAVMEAQALEAEGRLENAANRYFQFLETCRSHIHCALARSEYQRLQCLARP